MSATVTKQHRLSVARAWEGDPDVDGFRLETRRWAQTGLVVDADSAGLERLAQLVANAEGAWIHVDAELPDSDVRVLIVNHEPDYVSVELMFTDDSEGNGEPYWAADGGDLNLRNYPHWRPLPKPPEPT